MFIRLRFVLPCLLLVAAALCGCHNTPTPPPVANQPLPTPPAIHDPAPVPPTTPAKTSVKDVAVALMSVTNSAPFPKGTEVMGVSVDAGVATVNFNKAFSALANAGDSAESEAMKALQAALAQFPDVQKMRVTVEGKPFDSQNTDWNTPFAVRKGTTNDKGEAQGGGQ